MSRSEHAGEGETLKRTKPYENNIKNGKKANGNKEEPQKGEKTIWATTGR